MAFDPPGISNEFIYDTLASNGEVPVFVGWPSTDEIQTSKYHFLAFSRDGMEKGEGAFAYIERIIVSYVFPSTSEIAADLEDVIDILVQAGLNFREATEDTLVFKDTKEEYTAMQIIVTRPRKYSKLRSDANG
ncbi:hypothetical protein [Listeria booriae]|uniref:hypothetical protein n=1 Tax=Listeria booriae TaxID=1552123 RepID=UPI0016232A5F|nr:hypothetical protein [Listeria booriae]MBC2207415.1 hypothetical protein [Listeria booriae]